MKPLNVAKLAAEKAGVILLDSWNKIQISQIHKKQLNDYVTTVDLESEQKIISTIKATFPDHTIYAEESGEESGDSRYRWIIDPLDGTKNYIHGNPVCAISIALQEENKTIAGVVYDPFRNEMFYAEKDKGAFLNNQKITVSNETELSACLLATGFPFKRKDLLKQYLQTFSAIFNKVSGIRRAGAAAIDLVYVACGRFDGFWELLLSPWDIAAGAIIVQEAGGKITDMDGKNNYLQSGNIIASNNIIHNEMLNEISKNPPYRLRPSPLEA